MNAFEFQIELERLGGVITNIGSRSLNSKNAEDDLATLRNIWSMLCHYRLEMEAAEEQVGEAPTLVDVGDLGQRVGAIENRLDETAELASNLDQAASTAHVRLGAHVSRLNDNATAHVEIQKRLDKIERQIKHMDLLVSAVYSYLRERHPDFVPPSHPPEERVDATIAEAVSKYGDLLKRLSDTTNQAPEPPVMPSNAELRKWARTGNGPPDSWWDATDDPFKPVPAPPVDWDRWHWLLDLRAQRALSASEKQEYEEYVRLARELDVKEGRTADAALGNLVKEHERVIASIRRLTAAVRAKADAEQRSNPAPPVSERNAKMIALIDEWLADDTDYDEKTYAKLKDRLNPPPVEVEVEMRVECTHRTPVSYRWQCQLAGKWLGVPDYAGNVFFDSALAQIDGNAWLAALSKQLGVPLKANWVDAGESR